MLYILPIGIRIIWYEWEEITMKIDYNVGGDKGIGT